MGIDVYVTSLTHLWSDVPSRTLLQVVASTARLRRANAGSTHMRPSRAEWFELPWNGGRAWMSWYRRKLVNAYVSKLTERLATTGWVDDGDGPDPYGTRLDPQVGMFLRSVAIAASDKTLDAPAVIAATHEPGDPETRDFFAMMGRYVAIHHEAVPAVAFERFPNLMLLDIANVYLPVAFEGGWIGGPHDIGSAPRLAAELRDLAAVLGVDTTVVEWWKTRELIEYGPRSRALYNLHVLGEACALSASASLPIAVAG
jgi:hypothetical protein